MKKETEIHLRKVLHRLEQSSKKIVESRGYTKDAAQIRILEELIKEQLVHENISTSARPIR